jgi:hypothetical protein
MDIQVLGLGALGGILPDLIRIAKAQGNIGQVGGVNVLVSMVVLAIIGGVAAFLADAASTEPVGIIAAVTAGFSGPEIISRLVGGTSGGGGGPESFSTPASGVLGWWRV